MELASSCEYTESNCTKYYNLIPDESTRSVHGGEANDLQGCDVCLRLTFLRPQRAVTPGQAIVLYGPVLSGGGSDKDLPSHGRFVRDLERAVSTTALAGQPGKAEMDTADHDGDTVICAATIAFPGQSLYEQGVNSTIVEE